jgi:hypothetical protein
MDNQENQNNTRQRENQAPQEQRNTRRRLESEFDSIQNSRTNNENNEQAENRVEAVVNNNFNQAILVPRLNVNINDQQVDRRFQNAVRLARRHIDQRAMDDAPQQDFQASIETESPTSVVFLNRVQNNRGGGRGF